MLFSGKQNVFISFRGEDTRLNFTSHLYTALIEKKIPIPTFIDNNIVRGQEIWPSLVKEIEDSKISIVVLSQNYASSEWCLEELVKILDCFKNNGQMVIPVFYKVDPTDVCDQTGSFGEAFLKHEMVDQLKVQRWRCALTEVANLAGWDSSVTRPESELIKQIIKDVSEKLSRISPSYHLRGLVGIEPRIQKIISMLCLESAEVGLIGIWGMGGVGKTTLARAVYDQISTQFESCCFISNMKQQLENCTLSQLQDQLFSTLLDKESVNLVLSFIKDRLCRKKVLVVVDDANNSTQLQQLLLTSEPDFFGSGSRILVTSRDKQVLKNNCAAGIYTMQELNEDEALCLFNLNAFKQDHPKSAPFKLQSGSVIRYAKGNPLALKVLGSALYDRSDEDWKSMLKRLGNISNSEIHNILRTSFDGLDSEEQRVFLDIACFLNGRSRDDVTKTLGGFDSSEMGQKIVLDESRQPESRSRLWNPEDISYLLMENKGTSVIEGMSLDLSLVSSDIHLEPNTFSKMRHLRFLKLFWSGGQFSRCREVKLYFSRLGLLPLPKELRYLEWFDFSLKTIPSNFFPENLVVLNLRGIQVKELWTGIQHLVNLVEIDLSRSVYMTRLPDLSKARNMAKIDLSRCSSLVEVHSSIQYLNKLEFLMLDGCVNLRNLPRRIDSKVLKCLDLHDCPSVKRCPHIMQGNLERLHLNCSSMIEVLPSDLLLLSTLVDVWIENYRNVSSLPADFCKLKSLWGLTLRNWSELESLPEISEPINLESIDLSYCRNLKRLPDSICNLKFLEVLILDGTAVKEIPISIEHLCCLYLLGLRYCKYLESLRSCISRLHKLESLYIGGCESLCYLPELPPSLSVLLAFNCISLKTISSNRRKYLDLLNLDFTNCSKLDEKVIGAQWIFQHADNPYASIVYPGSKVPEWFSFQSMGASVVTQFPSNLDHMKGIAFCVVFKFKKLPKTINFLQFKIKCIDNAAGNNHGDVFEHINIQWYAPSESEHVLIVHVERNHLKQYLGTVSSFEFCPYGCVIYPRFEILKHCVVKRCGIHMLRHEAFVGDGDGQH
ncbi:disease resistance protein Roq1-like isoform X2 [Mercurialis annua]|uniref:disease resistance protein Roq1-like isoform X2 n=1 Tax=Mercurialis annua TaxID=3986 RepID=UPI00215F7EB9|nr:disease resistance protein Roq1-like isoform X2 [Mercurialis annua]